MFISGNSTEVAACAGLCLRLVQEDGSRCSTMPAYLYVYNTCLEINDHSPICPEQHCEEEFDKCKEFLRQRIQKAIDRTATPHCMCLGPIAQRI